MPIFIPWGRLINYFTHKQCLIYWDESLLIPLLLYLIPDIFKHGTRCGRGCLTSFILDTLGTLDTYHWWIAFGLLLNWRFCNLWHVWVYIFGTFPVCVELVLMVSSRVSASLSLQQSVDSTCCLSCGLFSHTHMHGRGLPVGILW